MSVHDREVISWPMAFALTGGMVVGIIAIIAGVNWFVMNFDVIVALTEKAFVAFMIIVAVYFLLWSGMIGIALLFGAFFLFAFSPVLSIVMVILAIIFLAISVAMS